MIKITNNQPRVGGSDKGDVIAERVGGGDRVGGHHPIVWGGEQSDNKINKIKYTMASDGRRSKTFHTTTNQK